MPLGAVCGGGRLRGSGLLLLSSISSFLEQVIAMALVGFQGRGFADGVQPDFCHALLPEALIFQ
jgi:hypothetical protein